METVIGLVLQTVIGLALVVVGIWYSWITTRMWRKLTAQVKSVSRHSLAALSNVHNWNLLNFRGSGVPALPAALPSWVGLSEDGWKWRVLHFNHLNLFRTVWEDLTAGVFDPSDVKDWLEKGEFIFRNATSGESQYEEGRAVLRQILRKEEGYPDEFYDWLVNHKIIPPRFVPDRPLQSCVCPICRPPGRWRRWIG